MTSGIDPNIPAAGQPMLATPIRENFQAAREDILALEAGLANRMLRASNLNDVASKPDARTNLGLGTLATQSASAVAITGGTLDNVVIGGTTPAIATLATLQMAGNMTAAPTGQFWSNAGARVQRINDRLLVGGAAASDAAKPSVTLDWLSALINWPVYNATAAITSSFGTIALTVGSQTLDLDPIEAGTTQTTIGVAAFAIANNPGTFPTGYFAAYGFYSEARVYPGTVSDAFAAEFEAMNLSGVANASPTPYRELQTGSAQALRLGSGGGQGLSPEPAISALAIVPNGSTFNTGIVFERGALTGTDGITGFGTAIAMAKGHMVVWYADNGGDGASSASILSNRTATTLFSMQFTSSGAFFYSALANATAFSISEVAASVNYVTVEPAVTGAAPGMRAQGVGTNANLALHARAGGRFEWTCTTQAGAVNGAGGALPANAEAFLQVAVNGSDYVVPLLKAS